MNYEIKEYSDGWYVTPHGRTVYGPVPFKAWCESWIDDMENDPE